MIVCMILHTVCYIVIDRFYSQENIVGIEHID